MLKSKTIERICCLALVVMLALTGAVWAGKARAGRKALVDMGYEKLFDQSTVHVIDIEMADWDSFIASATSEEYAECSVTIDGEKLTSVAIRGKGNTSLSSVAGMGSKKYSFKIEFDQFVKGRTYRGLDKLSLNNLIYDATLMKDYLAYTLMYKMGVPSPLCSFAQVNVNGEPWGLYLAVEGVEDSFLERNNMTTGELYKPDSVSFGGGRGNGRDFDFEQFRTQDSEATPGVTDNAVPDNTAPADSGDQGLGDSFGGSGGAPAQNGGFAPSNGASASDGDFNASGGASAQLPEGFAPFQETIPQEDAPSASDEDGNASRQRGFGGGFNFGMGNSDVKLQYIDDDPDSYSNIFVNAKTDVSKKDKARLIEALKTLSSENARDAVFTDEVIRYLAVHDFLQNDDSYTGMMVHNYYLYEEKGRLAIIPWDYNLAFGTMGGGGSASSVINSPIDSPVSNGTGEDRPLVGWIFSDEDALQAYHQVYSQFVAEIIESGWLESEIQRVAEMIRPYVEADAAGFYTAKEFDAGIQALQSYCALRGQSVRGQLDGDIPSTTAGQRGSAALVDAGALNLYALGSMNSGRNIGFGGGQAMPFAPSDGENDAFSGSSGSQADSFSGSWGNAAGGAAAGGNSFGGSAAGPANPAEQASPRPDAPQASTESIPPEQKQTEAAPTERPTAPPTEPAESARPAREAGNPGERGGRNMLFDFPQSGQQEPGVAGQQLLVGGLCLMGLLLAILLVFRVKGHNS